eukprot:COSAG02_NODE_8636_length_2497_cov_2.251043_2_plen_159_part_00
MWKLDDAEELTNPEQESRRAIGLGEHRVHCAQALWTYHDLPLFVCDNFLALPARRGVSREEALTSSTVNSACGLPGRDPSAPDSGEVKEILKSGALDKELSGAIRRACLISCCWTLHTEWSCVRRLGCCCAGPAVVLAAAATSRPDEAESGAFGIPVA